MFASQVISASPQRRCSHKRMVASVDKIRSETVLYFLALIFLVLLCSLFYIWSRVQIVNMGYAINKESALKERLVEENKKLILEGAILRSPVRLEKLAKNEYQMKLPENQQVINSIELKSNNFSVAVQNKESFNRSTISPSRLNGKSAKGRLVKLLPSKKPSTKTDSSKNARSEKKNDQKSKLLRSEVILKNNKRLM